MPPSQRKKNGRYHQRMKGYRQEEFYKETCGMCAEENFVSKNQITMKAKGFLGTSVAKTRSKNVCGMVKITEIYYIFPKQEGLVVSKREV